MDDDPVSTFKRAMDWNCPESVGNHGPADQYGRCPWCGRKYTYATQWVPDRSAMSDSEFYYRTHYDPDFEGQERWY